MPPTVVNDLSQVPAGKHAITIGNFDGVHRGHQLLLDTLRREAENAAAETLVITFDPLPAEVLAPDRAPARLMSGSERARLIEDAGIDIVALIPFDLEFASQEPLPFIKRLVDELGMVAIVVGSDFRFGHNRSGSVETLQALAPSMGFSVTIVERMGGEDISSTRARQLLADGDVRGASEILGRLYTLAGTVESGDQRGQTLGFPTANLDVPAGILIPPDGIYCALAQLENEDRLRPAIVYIGSRPTFGELSRAIEAYLLDFDDNLYGRGLTVSFVERIRGDKTFATTEELIQQMEADEIAARAILARPSSTRPWKRVEPSEERMSNG